MAQPATSSSEYEKLATRDSLDSEPTVYVPVKKQPYWKKIALSVPFLILVALAASIMLLAPKATPRSDDFKYTNCGNTSMMARAAGCHYEPMLRSWVPSECFYPDILEDYDVFRDREWFADLKLTIPANITELESGDAELAYTRFWHDEHCTYIFRKTAVAIDKRYPSMAGVMGDIEHSHHCAHMVASRIYNSYNASFLQSDKTFTESILGFHSCVELPWK